METVKFESAMPVTSLLPTDYPPKSYLQRVSKKGISYARWVMPDGKTKQVGRVDELPPHLLAILSTKKRGDIANLKP